MRVLVTGGAGFIGRQVVARLLERGDEVTVVDLKPQADEGVRHVQADLREPATVLECLDDGADAVVHLAALTRVLDSVKDPDGVFRTNVLGTHLILERCRTLGVPGFVFASTNAVVGDVGSSVITEEMVLRPLTPYGATKAAGEHLLAAYGACYGLHAVALRFTNVYGRGMQVKDSVIARLMRAALTEGGIQIYGDGSQVRDYVYVTDVVEAIELALELDRSDTFVIGSGESVSMLELHRIACEVTGVEIGAEHVPGQPGEMPAVVVDNSHAREAGWAPRHDLRAGIEATWKDFLQQS
ncbi:MAG TPA: NAD-dependent epimerase/dehydratase family protein [Acidimicrobiales bacterium]|nr:NAD-dependent epimerase/dehydratase family protein [Acidimicrobiales bacterium]